MTQSSLTVADRRLARLSQLLKTLRETVELTALLESTVSFLCKELGYSLVWFGIYDALQDCLIGHDGHSPGSRSLFHQERFPLEAGSLLEQVFVERRPAQVPDLRSERKVGAWRNVAQNIGIQGSLLFPLHYRDVSYGVALLGVPEWGRTPPPEEIAALSIVCGQLAVAIHQADSLKREQKQKRPEEPLLRLLNQLRHQPTLQSQLEQIIDETHPFIGASQTLLYWYDRDHRLFTPRLARQNQASGTPPSIPVADCERLYQTLRRDRILCISDTDSALQSDLSSYLQNQWRARALMLAPIGSEAQLLGFVAVAKPSPHLWSDEEKRYLEGVAQLVTLIAPQEKIEQALGTGHADQQIISRLGQAVRRNQDWGELLRQTADYLFTRIGIDRLMLVQSAPDATTFSILFQHQAERRKLLGGPLAGLDELDAALFTEHPEGLAIEDWNSDLRLMRWRAQLHDRAGVQSILVCPTLPGSVETGALIAMREQPKSWSQADFTLVQAIAQQLSTILHQRSLQSQINQLQEVQQSLRWGLMSLQQETHPSRIDGVGLRAIAQLLKAPWATFFSWSPREDAAHVAANFTSGNLAALPAELTLDPFQDPLLQQVLQSEEGVVIQATDLLPLQSRKWLQGKERTALQQVLVLRVTSPSNDIPQGAIVVGESRRRLWSRQSLELAQLLVQQLAWSRHSTQRLDDLQHRQTHLEQLNWYKQFCGERFHLGLSGLLNRLHENDGRQLSISGQQNLERANRSLLEMGEVFQTEQWEFQAQTQKVPVIRLLKQAKEQLDPKISQQQLWSQFHWSEVQQYQIQGEILKLACIIQSVLVAACDRCLIGGRLDIWCRIQAEGMLEFSITDNGILDPLLLSALQPEADPTDPIMQSILEIEPGLSLRLSRDLMINLGGSFELLPLQDGRTVSRLLIPGLSLS